MARRIIVVLADGLRADVVEPGTMPSLFSLGWEYTRAREAETVCPSTTVAALSSLATGVGPSTHGVLEPGIPRLKKLGGLRPLPRILADAHVPTTLVGTELGPAKRTLLRAMVAAAGISDVKLVGRCARVTCDAARSVLDRFHRGLAFLYLKDCDIAGHAHGWMSDAYRDAAAEVDAAIGSISPLAEHDLLIVTADHGGGGVEATDHDIPHPENARIPLVVAGLGVARNRMIGSNVSILDIPPTILWAFGLHLPNQYQGKVLLDAFAQNAEVTKVRRC